LIDTFLSSRNFNCSKDFAPWGRTTLQGETQHQSEIQSPAAFWSERRRVRRARIELRARLRPYNTAPNVRDEVRGTVDVSRDGIYVTTEHPAYHVGMHVYVACPHSDSQADREGELGRVVRVDSLGEGHWGVAVNFVRSTGYHHGAI
jgi:hypothetical protein